MSNLKTKTIVLVISILFFAIPLTFSTVQAQKTFELTCQNVNAMNHPGYKVIEQLAQDVSDMTNGRLKINQIAPGGMVESPQTFSATARGAIDMAITYGCYHGGDLKVAQASFAIPGDPRNVWELYDFYYNEGGLDFLRKHYSKKNVHYLAAGVWPGYSMMSKEKVRTIEDIKNLKVRAAGTMADMLTQLGVGTTFIPFAEIYQAMARGTIDATISGSHAENYLQSLYEVADYMVVPSFSSAQTLEILVNKDTWDAMPKKMQIAFETAAQKACFHFTRKFMIMTKTANDKMKDAGVEKVKLTDKTLQKIREASYKTWDNMAENNEATTKFFNMVREHLKSQGYAVE